MSSVGTLGPAAALLRREVVRFLRQRHRIIGALGTPLVFWFLIGSGLGRSFRSPLATQSGMDYLAFFFPGTLLLIVLFTAIFSTISIIEDRREGFLQGVLVSPAPRSSIVIGKISGGAVLAFGQAVLFAIAAPFLGFPFSFSGALYVLALLALVSYALTGLGFLIAWRMDSTQGFHAVMNLFLMPLWFLSGSLFPPDGAPRWLQWIMAANPLSYALTGLQSAFFGAPPRAVAYATPLFSFVVTAAFAVTMHVLCLVSVRGKSRS